jgi:hypothetical protein
MAETPAAAAQLILVDMLLSLKGKDSHGVSLFLRNAAAANLCNPVSSDRTAIAAIAAPAMIRSWLSAYLTSP